LLNSAIAVVGVEVAMTKRMSNMLGWILIIVGLIGFVANSFLWMHLNAAHSLVLIVTGILSLCFGSGEGKYAKAWCIIAGLVYGVISLIGLFCPPGMIEVARAGETSHLLRLVPGALEFGTPDNLWQLLVGVLYLVAGFGSRSAPITAPGAARTEHQEAGVR